MFAENQQWNKAFKSLSYVDEFPEVASLLNMKRFVFSAVAPFNQASATIGSHLSVSDM